MCISWIPSVCSLLTRSSSAAASTSGFSSRWHWSIDPGLSSQTNRARPLDVTVQEQTLRLMEALTDEVGAAVLLITHNLGVVRKFAQAGLCHVFRHDRRRGRDGATVQGAEAPLHQGASGCRAAADRRGPAAADPGRGARLHQSAGRMPLSAALPPCASRLQQSSVRGAGTRAPGEVCSWFLMAEPVVLPVEDPVLIRIEDLRRDFTVGSRKVSALAGVSLDIQRGRTVAVVGESGSGKTTLGNQIPRYRPADIGANPVRRARNRRGPRHRHAAANPGCAAEPLHDAESQAEPAPDPRTADRDSQRPFAASAPRPRGRAVGGRGRSGRFHGAASLRALRRPASARGPGAGPCVGAPT